MIAIVDYDAGNVRSVINALRRLGVTEWVLTADPSKLREADKVLLPGVGDASVAIGSLRSCGLDTVIKTLEKPVLGICVGMQALCRHSEEGDAEGLGIFDAQVRRFRQDEPAVILSEAKNPGPVLKVPHMGWNRIHNLKTGIFNGLDEGSFVYFVHSYYAGICLDTVATTTYGVPFSAALCRDNFYGTQFHPEKSGSVGSLILKNFLEL